MNISQVQKACKSKKVVKFSGKMNIPGDKSISHRSLIISSMAIGKSEIENLLLSADIMATKNVLKKLGVIIKEIEGTYYVDGLGVGGLSKADDVLDFGNSGTAVRLMIGVLASHNFTSQLTGDASLNKRPMKRVIDPLMLMGMEIIDGNDRLPLSIKGASEVLPLKYEVPVPSAQVKSALLLAGINCRGNTIIVEKVKTRTHTENMLEQFGCNISSHINENEENVVELQGMPYMKAQKINVPSDPSSASFAVLAAVICENAEIICEGILWSEERNGFFITLKEMGADIEIYNERKLGLEDVVDIKAKSSKLKGVTIPAGRAASMIDEFPAISIAASYADGESKLFGLEELRYKECDRLAAICDGLIVNGVEFNTESVKDDNLFIKGKSGNVRGGSFVKTHMDHRIAMAFLIMGMASEQPIEVDDISMIDTSFPDFIQKMNKYGANFV